MKTMSQIIFDYFHEHRIHDTSMQEEDLINLLHEEIQKILDEEPKGCGISPKGQYWFLRENMDKFSY